MSLSTSSFRRFALQAILPVVLILAVLFVLIDYVFTQHIIYKTEISTTARIQTLQNSSQKIIPILGSSRARCSYIPELIHPHAYNVGIDGASLEVSLALLDIALQKEQVDTVILNFDYDYWETIGDKRDYIPLSHRKEIEQMLQASRSISVWDKLPALRYFNAYDYYLKEFINQKLKATKEVRKGYTFDKHKKTFNKKEFNAFVEKRLKEKRDWQANKQFERLLKLAAAYPQKQIYLVCAAYHNSYYQTFNDFKTIHKRITNSLQATRNIQFIAPTTSAYSDTLFTNTTHLNHWGALRFSKHLRKILFECNSK